MVDSGAAFDIEGLSLAGVVAWTLIHSLWQGTIAWLLLLAGRAATTDAALRTRLANACLAGFLTLQLATAAALSTRSLHAPAMSGVLASTHDYPLPTRTVRNEPVVELRPMPPPPPGGRVTAAVAPTLPWIFGGWLALVAVRLLAISRDSAAVRHAIDTSLPVPAEMAAALEPLGGLVALRRPVAFVCSPAVVLPAVARWRRPVVLLPVDDPAHRFPPGNLRALVLHELAHIARNDFATTLARSAILSLYYFHPAIHAICRLAIRDSEQATDDLAAWAFGDRPNYGAAFVDAAERAFEIEQAAAREHAGDRRLAAARSAGGGSMVARVSRLIRLSDAELAETRPMISAGLASGGMTLLLVAAFFVSAAEADRRERAWIERRSLGEAVIATVAADRDNPALPAAMRSALAELRATDGLGPTSLDALADALLRGAPARALDEATIAQRLTPAAAGAEPPSLGDFGTAGERLRLRDLLIAAAQAEPTRRRRERLARATLAVAALETASDGGARLKQLMLVVPLYQASGLSNREIHRLYLSYCLDADREAFSRQCRTMSGQAFAAAVPQLVQAIRFLPASQAEWRRAASAEQLAALQAAARQLDDPARFRLLFAPATTRPRPSPSPSPTRSSAATGPANLRGGMLAPKPLWPTAKPAQ